MDQQLSVRGPAIPGLPPMHFAGWVAMGWALEMMMPAVTLSEVTVTAGWVLLALGVTVNLWAVTTFRQARTSLHVRRAAERMDTTGPYRFSRNPLYLSMITSIVGFALIADAFWMAAVVPLIVLYANKVIVEPEEIYLEQCFGERYLGYKNGVRRWL